MPCDAHHGVRKGQKEKPWEGNLKPWKFTNISSMVIPAMQDKHSADLIPNREFFSMFTELSSQTEFLGHFVTAVLIHLVYLAEHTKSKSMAMPGHAIRNPSPQPFLTLRCGTTTLDVVEVNVTLVHEEVVEVEPLLLFVIDVFVDIADVVETPQFSPLKILTCQRFPKFKKCFCFFGDLKLPTPCWSIMTSSCHIATTFCCKTPTWSTFHAKKTRQVWVRTVHRPKNEANSDLKSVVTPKFCRVENGYGTETQLKRRLAYEAIGICIQVVKRCGTAGFPDTKQLEFAGEKTTSNLHLYVSLCHYHWDFCLPSAYAKRREVEWWCVVSPKRRPPANSVETGQILVNPVNKVIPFLGTTLSQKKDAANSSLDILSAFSEPAVATLTHIINRWKYPRSTSSLPSTFEKPQFFVDWANVPCLAAIPEAVM